jgi:hypothetical protein
MAITRAQQAKQMLREGGRIGFKGGADMGTVSARDSKGNVTRAATARSVNISPSGNVTTSRDAPDAPFTYIGGNKIDVIPENRDQRELLELQAAQKRQKEINEFINRPPKPINTPFPLITTGLNTAQKFLPYKVTRKFYADDVVGRTVTLPDGTTVTYDLDNYDEYDQLRKEGIINAYGRPLTDAERSRFDDDSDNSNFIPVDDGEGGGALPDDPDDPDDNANDEDEGLNLRFRKDGGRINAMDGGIMNTSIIGGAADGNIDEMGRQMYFVGKLVKKATRAVKKIAKSPIGKAALLAGSGYLLGGGTVFGKALPGLSTSGGFAFRNIMPNLFGVAGSDEFGGTKGILGKLKLTEGFGALKPTMIGGITAASAIAGMLTPEQEEEAQRIADETGIDIAEIRANPDKYLARRFRADGGIMRLGYQEGSKEPVAKKTMPLLDMDGKEMDLREDGGFVPLGRMERADDVPARLSKNEFVFTADAVRNAGDGDVDKGAEVMYNMMKNLESGGDVSEESQGLEGAREMFQTSQRLEEVL